MNFDIKWEKILLVGNRGHKNMWDEIILVWNIQLLLKQWKKLYIACSDKKWLNNRLVCHCFGVRKSDISLEVENNLSLKVTDISDLLFAGAGCGSCLPDINETIRDVQHSSLS